MADDDDWETDADFENNLTEAERRAYGNVETKKNYEKVMDKSGSSAPGESISLTKVLAAAPAPAGPSARAVEYGVKSVATPPPKPATPPKPAPPAAAPAPKPAPAPPPPPPMPAPPATPPAPPPPTPPPPATPPTTTPGKLDTSKFGSPAAAASPATASSPAPAPGKLDASKFGAPAAGASGAAAGGKNVLNRTRRISDAASKELIGVFQMIDADGSGTLTIDELVAAFEKLGMSTPRDKVVAMLKAVDEDGNGSVNFEEFVAMAERLKAQRGPSDALGSAYTEMVDKGKAKLTQVTKSGGHTAVHSFAVDECLAYADFLNSKLAWDPKLKYLLPITDFAELFGACSDGVLLCKLINVAAPETIDERVINMQPNNRFLINENLNLAIQAAKSIGIKVVNIGASDIAEANPILVLGLMWQIIKSCLLSKINLKENPNLIRLLEEGESLEMLLKLPPEKLLMRWFNYQLKEAGSSRRVEVWSRDLKDSELYAHLLSQIDPEKKCNTRVLSNADLTARATYVAAQGQRLGADFTVQPADIVSGNEKLNLAFVAALFNACPGLAPPEDLSMLAEMPSEDDSGDSREERAFRMWINSLGIESIPEVCESGKVDNLFEDVKDGLVLLHTMDKLKPGTVSWKEVNTKDKCKMVFKRNENGSKVVELGKQMGFSLVGVGGKDIVDGNKKLLLGLVWQMMRMDMMGFLAKVRAGAGGAAMGDKEMVAWANGKVSAAVAAGVCATISDFGDKRLADGLYLFELLAAIEPRCVNRTLITEGATDEEKQLNAKYVISSARKIGCSLFLIWEDIVEVKPKMILSFVAAVMAHDMQK